jgi:hypothetical protein
MSDDGKLTGSLCMASLIILTVLTNIAPSPAAICVLRICGRHFAIYNLSSNDTGATFSC